MSEISLNPLFGKVHNFDLNKCIFEYVDSFAETNSDHVAVIHGESSLTYGDLSLFSDRLANDLAEMNAKKGDVIGISLERTIESIIAILAIHKLGACYLPINPKDPADRFRYFLDDANVKILLTTHDLANPSVSLAMPLVKFSLSSLSQRKDFPKGTAHYLDILRKNEPRSDDIAYVIYTSGSTGRPKGVQITRRGLSNYIQWTNDYLGMPNIDGAVVSNPLTFDAKVTSIFPPLVCGKTVVLPSEKTDILSVFKALTNRTETYLYKVLSGQIPNLINMLKSAGVKTDQRKHVFVIGGDKLSINVYETWKDIFPNSHIIHHYGPTETVCGCSIFDPNVYGTEGLQFLPIGKPIYNTSLFILDESMQLVNQGEKGELFIGGAGVAKGYLNRDELTEQKFITNESIFGDTSRLYRTGDIVVQRADGNIEFLGRVDNQVKISGYRVELGEIEKQILESGFVKNCLVIAATHESGLKGIFAYAIPANESISLKEVREKINSYLLQKIPPYMVPMEYFLLDQFELTDNGKIARKLLPTLEGFAI